MASLSIKSYLGNRQGHFNAGLGASSSGHLKQVAEVMAPPETPAAASSPRSLAHPIRTPLALFGVNLHHDASVLSRFSESPSLSLSTDAGLRSQKVNLTFVKVALFAIKEPY